MLQSIKDTITVLLFIVALDNGATINLDDLGTEIIKIIDGRSNIEELTFDELLDIMKILKKYVSNAA